MERVCSLCGSPDRLAWLDATAPLVAALAPLDVGQWISLCACPQCDARWIEAPTGPHDTVSDFAAWPHHDPDFRALHDIDAGATLTKWHRMSCLRAAIATRRGQAWFGRFDRTLRALRRQLAAEGDEPDLPMLIGGS